MCRQYPHIQWVHHPSRDLRDPPNRVNGVLMNHMLIEQKEGKRNRSAVLNHAIFFFFLLQMHTQHAIASGEKLEESGLKCQRADAIA